jgi:hypothetical protein
LKGKALKELYLGGETLKREELMPDDFKNFFVNFVNYLLGRDSGGKK